ncbi:ATP-dependent exoDNAse (exonuclease V) beta subunit [Marinilabilia salmonicolor]|jgi:ATP-dependent exoDNAse (exonuclease V) beta subunit|uniref:UvrD-helicase domain-containing protein n=1 Tax=Marinilabilia salmonicolor TaxID=989 RepID=UPI000D05F3CB|nr:UvrD-helicase domain-containing protein [Marinilabilia salmonicolor]PRY99994.1 ATP-dependent exoDNAse (exonuclease V) beta subunit [Marinilabilia salmonicolor]
MSKLTIYRASAGSGKTFTLTREFIKLLFNQPSEYRNILAVTFTNKATAEMRRRILEKLFELGNPAIKKPDYLDELMQETEWKEEKIRERARFILRLLLHDFSRFSVNTIDSFFQQIIRAFARDAGLQLGFRTELDHKSVMTQAIDRVVLEMDMKGHETLKKWLLDFAEKKITEGKSWNINNEISNFSQEIFKEAYQSVAGPLSEKLSDKSFMNQYLSKLQKIISNYEQTLKTIGVKGLEIIKKWDLDISKDFNGGSRSKLLVFKKLSEEVKFDEAQIFALHNTLEAWQKKTNPEHINKAIEGAYNDGLNALLDQYVSLKNQQGKDYFTARAIVKNFYTLGIINDVYQKILEVSREQNVFLLSGTNHLLTRIIRRDEAPFIYERTGTRYHHYMIDEFQDTSSMQYANFRPLISNSLAQENFAMLVGDVKQSIYRWRNSDWTLLAEQVEKEFDIYGTNIETLDTNFRSSANVIAFNNSFFQHISRALQAQLIQKSEGHISDTPGFETKISEAYHDVAQKVAAKNLDNEGHVSFQFLEAANKEDFREQAIEASINRIRELLNSGFSPSDICVLVRKKTEGIAITNALLSGAYHPEKSPLPVISNETLRLNSSPAVLFIINHLKFILSPDDKVLEAFIRLHWERNLREADMINFDASDVFHNAEKTTSWEEHLAFIENKQQLPLYDLADELTRLLPENIRTEQGIYIQALLNNINSFSAQEAANLNLFIDEWEKNIQFESIAGPENQEAIQVMTVHKSKGLEFKAVVLPFCNWELNDERQQNLLWCKPRSAPFNELDLVPVNYEKSLVESHFSNEYLEELMHQYIDNLNLLYVAFTRAELSLSAFCQKKKTPPKELGTVSDLLWFHFEARESDHHELPGNWNTVSQTFELGTMFREAKESKDSDSEKEENSGTKRLFDTCPLPTMETFPFRERIAIHLESDEYFDDEKEESGITYGKIMHHLFEMIETHEDLDDALKTLWFEGKIDEKEQSIIRERMEKWLNHPEVESWFNGSYKILPEVAILHKNIRRPDRVMLSDKETIVVDYKFGKAEATRHQLQVRGYMNKIKEMGHPNVKGYIWYVPHQEVVKVENDIIQGSLF